MNIINQNDIEETLEKRSKYIEEDLRKAKEKVLEELATYGDVYTSYPEIAASFFGHPKFRVEEIETGSYQIFVVEDSEIESQKNIKWWQFWK